MLEAIVGAGVWGGVVGDQLLAADGCPIALCARRIGPINTSTAPTNARKSGYHSDQIINARDATLW